jgi:vancomycin resistance protein YoaR
VKKGNNAYLYEKYRNGKSLDVEKTLANFEAWTQNQTSDILFYNEKKPEILSSGLVIIDVTKLLAQGKTRIDIIRNGKFNWGMLNAEYGLKAIDNFVIEPKQEFSFIRDSGAERHAYHIGGGICNATTTMFRTALEAGFEITERHQHFLNVASYAWGYPENVVDSAYFSSNPRLDLKFVNDLDYPVLLKLEITRDNNNFQYHTVSVYTNPNIPERKVEFYDFKKWNIRSEKVFNGSFSRKVYQSGVLLRQDTFESKYR